MNVGSNRLMIVTVVIVAVIGFSLWAIALPCATAAGKTGHKLVRACARVVQRRSRSHASHFVAFAHMTGLPAGASASSAFSEISDGERRSSCRVGTDASLGLAAADTLVMADFQIVGSGSSGIRSILSPSGWPPTRDSPQPTQKCCGARRHPVDLVAVYPRGDRWSGPYRLRNSSMACL